jgi:hypothetical protein
MNSWILSVANTGDTDFSSMVEYLGNNFRWKIKGSFEIDIMAHALVFNGKNQVVRKTKSRSDPFQISVAFGEFPVSSVILEFNVRQFARKIGW